MSIPSALAADPVRWALIVVVTAHGHPLPPSIFADFTTLPKCVRALGALSRLTDSGHTIYVSTCQSIESAPP